LPRGEALRGFQLSLFQFPAHTRRMAQKAAKDVASALRADSSGHTPDTTPRQKPSALLDTRVVYCGDNLKQLSPRLTGQYWDLPIAKKLV